MADDDLASSLQNGGFAKLGKIADPQTSVDAVKSAEDSIGNIGKKIQDFYKKSIGQKEKPAAKQTDWAGAYGRTSKK